jgi:LysM repeat protein
MAGRSPLRFLAPVALIVFAFALFSVVNNDDEPTGTNPASQTATATPTETPEGKQSTKKKKTKTYTVKAGDTASAIAEEAGMDLQTLLELNPDLDPSTLSPGEKIRLEK